MALYKYSEARFIDSLVGAGNVRIGTLFDYRKGEHKAGISDATEGTKLLTHEPAYEVLQGNTPRADSFSKHLGFNLVGPGRATFLDCIFERHIEACDCFIYCFSRKFSAAVLREFEGADACAQITSVPQFCEALTQALAARVAVKFEGVFPVRYQERIEQWNGANGGSHPALIKQPKFMMQHELRAIWSPLHDGPIDVQYIETSNAHRFCKRISTLAT